MDFKFDILNIKYNQNISKEMDPTFDYTLKIEFEICSVKDLQEILNILYNSPNESHKDILEMTDHIIIRIKDIGYDLKLEIYKGFCEFVHYLFKVLKKIRAEDHVMRIYEIYNNYVKGEPFSPVMNTPTSPEVTEEVKPPKFMKKVKKSIRRN